MTVEQVRQAIAAAKAFRLGYRVLAVFSTFLAGLMIGVEIGRLHFTPFPLLMLAGAAWLFWCEHDQSVGIAKVERWLEEQLEAQEVNAWRIDWRLNARPKDSHMVEAFLHEGTCLGRLQELLRDDYPAEPMDFVAALLGDDPLVTLSSVKPGAELTVDTGVATVTVTRVKDGDA